jgi:outer membrane protein OmpA-like peptidoglycan-associated protein
MKCNWWRWLWGIIPLLMLSWVAVHAEQGRIEADLRTQAAQALAKAGLSWVAVKFSGRDATVSGQASDEAEPENAARVLNGVWGVRVVDNQIDLAPMAKKYTWTAGRRGNRIRLTGYVPNRATRKVILGVAKANFPGFEVVDRMATTRGVPAIDTWLGGVSFALKQLAGLKKGDVRLENLTMWISGEAEDAATYNAIKSALANGLPKGINLTDDLVTAPVVSPFTWSAQFADGRLVLSGYVPNNAARAELVAGARASVPGGMVEDKMMPGEGAPQGWSNAVAAVIRQISRLESGTAEMSDATLTVSGLASDMAKAEVIRAALLAGVPTTIQLTDHIKGKEPPPPPPLPSPSAPAPNADVQPPAPMLPQPIAVPPSPPTLPQPSAPAPVTDAQPTAPVPPQQPAVALPPPSPPSADPKPDRSPEPPAAAATSPAASAAPAQPPAASRATAPPATAEPPASAAASPTPAAPTESAPGKTPATPPVQPEPSRTASVAEAQGQARAKACEERLQSLMKEGRILFRVRSSELDMASFATLDRIAEAAKSCPNMSIEVGGHASAEGSQAGNQRLSVRRAKSVISYLTKAGVDASQLQSVGYGATVPVAPNDTSDNMAKNRRIEFKVWPK